MLGRSCGKQRLRLFEIVGRRGKENGKMPGDERFNWETNIFSETKILLFSFRPISSGTRKEREEKVGRVKSEDFCPGWLLSMLFVVSFELIGKSSLHWQRLDFPSNGRLEIYRTHRVA